LYIICRGKAAKISTFFLVPTIDSGKLNMYTVGISGLTSIPQVANENSTDRT